MILRRGNTGFAVNGACLAIAAGLLCAGDTAAADLGAGIEEKARVCFACHGTNGASTNALYPILAGQHQYYLYIQLKDFQAGRRANPEMKPFLAAFSREELLALAEFFSRQEWPPPVLQPDPALVAAGKTAETAGECPQCHLGGYNGASGVPRLAGQHEAYLRKTMLDFKSKARNSAPAMASLMESYSAQEIEALAHYLASMTVQSRAVGAEIQ